MKSMHWILCCGTLVLLGLATIATAVPVAAEDAGGFLTGLHFDIKALQGQEIGVSSLDTGLIADYIIARVNNARANRGLPPLAESGYLNGVAQAHSDHMVATKSLHHDALPFSGGENVGTMLPGRVYIPCPRTLHSVPNTEDGIAKFMMHAFMRHDRCQANGHKKNILRASFHTIGVGVSYGYSRYWITQDFGY